MKKKLTIWMDHSIAYIMVCKPNHFEIETIESKFRNKEKKQVLDNLQQQQQLSLYYKNISDIIKNYNQVILFGPTNAKIELFDILSEDNRFVKIKIEIKNNDKIIENHRHNFIKEYFSKT
ncbi:hypothetical protein [Flavobacterium sp. CG_23.5]|uniref:hypothetical protein n=1 Tax=Flavobacterium sp. CG_23.5 TaxID=2760708 RepID=UPI001AE5C190|nr:hypothetical protein [Flavobacterium sp. CG_23.5]